ncbi:MAG: DnaJ domain-containing protein [Chloroherpetonaceae bacterium]|nr:DnaJ domain-containing protein [Chthonomonadaceae bacterium]MDW8206550.1 DnaJ domain-containing protein [Chloroherpetonaceae bacterium]
MSGQPDYYAVLGLKPEATAEEIKKRYRELARRYHPDVNPSPEAAQKIKAVNEAYHILGDPDRRALYDAERFLSRKPAVSPATSSSVSRTPPPRNTPPQPRPAPGKMEFNGFGRTPPSSSARARRPSPAQERSSGTAAGKSAQARTRVEQLLKEAQLAFVNRQYRQAEELCRQVLSLDARCARAHEILGDVYTKRGHTEKANTEYSYAVQLDPHNVNVQNKLEHLNQNRKKRSPRVTYTSKRSSWTRLTEGPERELFLGALATVLFLAWLGVFVLLKQYPGAPIGILPVPDLSLNLFVALGMNGLFSGMLLALYGGMRPFSEELMTTETQEGRTPVALGMLLTAFALLWFYASLLVYFGIAFARNRFSPSVLRVYGVTLLQIVLVVLLYHPAGADAAGVQVAALAGNVLFPAMLLGWALGDAVRLGER